MAIIRDLEALTKQADQLSLLMGLHACQYTCATDHHLHCFRVHLLQKRKDMTTPAVIRSEVLCRAAQFAF